MNRLKLAVCLESLGLPLKSALSEGEGLGVTGVQFDAAGDLAPRNLSQTGRRELVHRLRAHNLTISALGCPLRHGLEVSLGQEGRIEHVKQVLSLSYDLGPRLVLISAGAVPADAGSAQGSAFAEALTALGRHAERTGAMLALETGLESGKALSDYLARFDTGGLGVSYDPANFLIGGFDPYEGARALQGRVLYVQAKDARTASGNRTGQEVALGHGQLDYLALVAVLEEIEYSGWVAVRRDSGDSRRADVANGVAFLRRLVGQSA
jgi:L-ribulose-5-phosphate 3-epimerase